MDRQNIALNYKHKSCNCCQAVLLSYADKLGLSEKTLLALGSGFGLGMGGMQGNCGALIGAVMVDNLMNSRHNAANARYILARFQSKCGAVTCKELKGIETSRMLCSCDVCVKNAVDILENQ